VTLSGVVSEMTLTGRIPLEGARVFVSDDQDGRTDLQGAFRYSPVSVCVPAEIVISVTTAGYDDEAGQPPVPGYKGAGWRSVRIDGDMHLDLTLSPLTPFTVRSSIPASQCRRH
jgi:hypothetical protein